MNVNKGEIYYVLLKNGHGKPMVIVSDDNYDLKNAVGVILAHDPNQSDLHVTVLIREWLTSMTACCESLWLINEKNLGNYIGRMRDNDMENIGEALARLFGLYGVQDAEPERRPVEPIRRHRWRKDDDEWLIANYPTRSVVEIAAYIGCTETAAACRYNKLIREQEYG